MWTCWSAETTLGCCRWRWLLKGKGGRRRRGEGWWHQPGAAAADAPQLLLLQAGAGAALTVRSWMSLQQVELVLTHSASPSVPPPAGPGQHSSP